MSTDTHGRTPAPVDDDDSVGGEVIPLRRRVAGDDQDDAVVAVRPGDEYDAERVPVEPARDGGPVDPPQQAQTLYATVTGWVDEDRPPLVPAWMRNRDQRRQAVSGTAGYLRYRAVRFLFKLPKYLLRVAWYAPRGAWRLTWAQVRWAWHPQLSALLQHAADTNDVKEGARVERQVAARHKARFIWLAVEAGLLTAATLLLRHLAPWWAQAGVAAVMLLLLTRAGQPAGKPLTDRVSQSPRYYRLTAQATRAAIVACGVGVKDPEAIKFPRDIFRDGPGHSAIVDLPADPVVVTAEAVISKRDELAGALRLPKSQVWPATIPGEHPSRLQLWVAERPVNDMDAPPWGLLTKGQSDYWRPFVYGHDERMRPVTWRLDERNSLFAGIPGTGKSRSVRVVVLGGICDPLVTPILFELKGTGDYDQIAPLCPEGMYGSGADEHTKMAALDAMEWLLRECDRRGPLIKQWVDRLGLEENKLSREVARRDPRLRPILAVFDEVQELFASPNKDVRIRAINAATSLVKRSRALGIHVILATQRIDDKSIPKGISSNIANRLCLGVNSHTEVELVLGTGTYRRGARPTEFEPGPDSGWGWVVGLGKMRPVKAIDLDNSAARQVVARARAMREHVQAADMTKAEARDFLADLRGVFRAGEAWVSWPQLAQRLAEQHPDVYAAVTADAVSSQARGLGVDSANGKVRDEDGRAVKRDGKEVVARGARSMNVDDAINRRSIEDA